SRRFRSFLLRTRGRFFRWFVVALVLLFSLRLVLVLFLLLLLRPEWADHDRARRPGRVGITLRLRIVACQHQTPAYGGDDQPDPRFHFRPQSVTFGLDLTAVPSRQS